MNIAAALSKVEESPAFVLDKLHIQNNAARLSGLASKSGCKPLYSIKALPFAPVLRWVKDYVHGFSVSSLFEARLASEILQGQGSIHLTTPGIRPDEIHELQKLCSHISFNSLTQWQRYSPATVGSVSLGLRINPQLSFTRDSRYDPCRPCSKLGASLASLEHSAIPDGVQGLHVHTVFGATNFNPMLQTLTHLQAHLGASFKKLHWINLGGGYLYSEIVEDAPFIQLVQGLKYDYGLEVYIEPGNALVGKAGYLVSTVIDTYISDTQRLAVLDTSVSHLPEVFEYQIKPEVMGMLSHPGVAVTLVGSTCLAGDVFGEYQFDDEIKIGDKIIFQHVGAYSLIKASRFNGYPLPTVYQLSAGELSLLKQDSYRDFLQQWWV